MTIGVNITIASSIKPPKGRFHDTNVSWLWAPTWDGPVLSRLRKLFSLMVRNVPAKRIGWLLQNVAMERSLKQRLVTFFRLLPFTRGEWDIIYFAWNATATDYQALYQLGIPIIVSCRGSHLYVRPNNPNAQEYTQKLRYTLKHAAAIHCVSQDILDEAVCYGADANKAKVIYPAVDPNFYSPTENKTNTISSTILMVGSLIWRKGYEYALISFHDLINQGVDAQLLIIGEGKEKSRIQFAVEELDLRDRVQLLGKVSPEIARNYMRQADLFLHSAVSEAFCNAVLEAQSTELPVITTDADGLPENVIDGITGMVVPTRDPAAMTAALLRLCNDPELRKTFGAAGRQRVCAEFDLKDQAKQFRDLFMSVLRTE